MTAGTAAPLPFLRSRTLTGVADDEYGCLRWWPVIGQAPIGAREEPQPPSPASARLMGLLLGRSSPGGLSWKGHLEADALGIEEFIESALPR